MPKIALPSDAPHPAALEIDDLLAQCETRRQRRSGPGGQHRNKVETAIVLKHRPTGIEGQASERRSQQQNKTAAIRRLRINLAIEARRAADSERTPSLLWNSRCRNGRISVSPRHDDYPAILAEALDVLFDEEAETSAAAKRLACTASQLVKLVKSEPRAWTLLNEHRSCRGLPPLK